MKNITNAQQLIDFLHVAEVKITYVPKVKPSERLAVKCSGDAHKIFFDSWNQNTIEHKETFKMLLLNRANKVLGITTISEGGLSGTVGKRPVTVLTSASNNFMLERMCFNNL